MSPLGRWRKDPLRRLGLRDPITATALIVRGDPGYSASTWWTATLRLRITAPGQRPVLVEHECRASREQTPYAGLTVPVGVERDDPTQVRILWSEVPTLEERIANRYPLLLAPRAAWRDIVHADPEQVARRPDYGDESVPGWTPGTRVSRGRQAATALVIGHSWDPAADPPGNGSTPSADRYRYGGKLQAGEHEYLGWLLLCVIPPQGDRYAVHLRTEIRRDRLGPVLPVGIKPRRPDDVQIAWQAAPEVPEPAPAIEEPEPENAPPAKPRRAPARKPARSSTQKVASTQGTSKVAAGGDSGKAATARGNDTAAAQTNGKPAASPAKPAKPRPAAKKPATSGSRKPATPRQVKAAAGATQKPESSSSSELPTA